MPKNLSEMDWQQLAQRADQEVNRTISDIIRSVPPDDTQKNVDVLRVIHQVVSYHLGTIEALIISAFGGETANEAVVKKLLEERSSFIKKGYEHGAYHESGSESSH